MPYEIKDRLSIKIFFAGVEFMFERANNLNFLHMSASSKIGVPMLHFLVDDVVDFFADQTLLGDGIPIEIVLSANSSDTPSTTYNFRLNTFKKRNAFPGTQYEIDAYLDVPAYWHQSGLRPRKGTSSQVLSDIAADCELKFDGPTTNDSMIWFPGNKKYHSWAREIASKSYRSPTALMQLGLEFDKTLKFRDVAQLDDEAWYASMMDPKQGYILVTDFQPSTHSGTNNARHNYSSARVYQNMLKNVEKFNDYDDKIEVQPFSGEVSFSRNTKLGNAVTRGNVVFAPLEFGNVHDKYQRSLYQNVRQNALFSQACSIVTPDVTDVKLFDSVFLSFGDSNNSSSLYQKLYSGVFKAVSRSIYVHANNYYEKFDLLRRASPVEVSEN